MDTILVQTQAFNAGELTNRLASATTAHGALVTFTGLVRDQTSDPVESLFLEHYPGMTDSALNDIVAQAKTRWPLGPVTLVHRVGLLYPGDSIVFVGVTSAHRAEAFQACEFLIDYLKVKAPFWKKETTPSGQRWVATRSSDNAAAERW